MTIGSVIGFACTAPPLTFLDVSSANHIPKEIPSTSAGLRRASTWQPPAFAADSMFSAMAPSRHPLPEALFPGGFLPTLTLLLQTMQAGSQGRLIVDSVSNIGLHYVRTLREWRWRFLDRFETVIVPALKHEYPDVMNGPRGKEEIEVF
ncbi:hypothetical protein DXG01_012415 [Tephrocybe rancida]|nr:hypothetical protein DXG01_012415 [Tephrocybe rancida]